MSIPSEGIPKIYAKLWAILLTRARCDSAGLTRSFETNRRVYGAAKT
jgi:hypothetical protein